MNKFIITTNFWSLLLTLLYLSFKSDVFNIGFQANIAGIAQMIVFRVLTPIRIISLFRRFGGTFCYHVLGDSFFFSSGCIHLKMKVALWRLSFDIFKHYMLKLTQCGITFYPKFGNKTNCGSSYDCLCHSISQRKLLERETHKNVCFLFSYHVYFIRTSLLDKRRAVIQLKQMLFSILNIYSLYIWKTAL
jgi:hypothetical protein